MSFLKALFGGKKKVITNKVLEKLVNKISSTSVAKIEVDDAKCIIPLLIEESEETKKSQQQFFKFIEESKITVIGRLKLLIIIHKSLMEAGEVFATPFSEFHFHNFVLPLCQKSKMSQQQQREEWMQNNIFKLYFSYIQRLSLNVETYMICISEGCLPQSDDIKLDYKLKFMWMFQISNLFSHALSIKEALEIIFKENSSNPFIQDIGFSILSDCINYYSVITQEIEKLTQTYPLLIAVEAIQFFQIYTELLSLTQQLKNFFYIKSHFDIKSIIRQPKWFEIDEKTNSEIEMHSKKMELLHSAGLLMTRTQKLKESSTKSKIKSNFTESAPVKENIRSKSILVNCISTSDDKESVNGMLKRIKKGRIKTEASFQTKKNMDGDIIFDVQQLNDIQKYELFLQQQKNFNQEQKNEDSPQTSNQESILENDEGKENVHLVNQNYQPKQQQSSQQSEIKEQNHLKISMNNENPQKNTNSTGEGHIRLQEEESN